ncbi:hypothetical protein EB001_15130 [bacterium]|nr:hypothetical protein [bacterium]
MSSEDVGFTILILIILSSVIGMISILISLFCYPEYVEIFPEDTIKYVYKPPRIRNHANKDYGKYEDHSSVILDDDSDLESFS